MTPNQRDTARWAHESKTWIDETDWSPLMNNIFGMLGGRKFLAAIFGALAIALHSSLGIPEDAVAIIGGIVAAYIFGQGIADGLSKGETSSVVQRQRVLDRDQFPS